MTDELTLRDKFAMAAMTYLAGNEMGANDLAETAYYIADAMIRRRAADKTMDVDASDEDNCC